MHDARPAAAPANHDPHAGTGGVRWLGPVPPWVPAERPAIRVIVDNDFAGDPDDLVQLAHHLLSPSVDLRAVISSHLRPGDPFDPGPHAARHGAERLAGLAEVLRVDLSDVLVVGSELGLEDERTPRPSAGVDRIVAEARRTDTDQPLFVACGGGLTEVASALLLAPDVADRLTVVWIGGAEDPAVAVPPPGNPTPEYNLGIDLVAARVVLASRVPLWQVPRSTYRQALVSTAELRDRVGGAGALGDYLHGQVAAVLDLVAGLLGGRRETYVLGDQPLVLLTALQTVFEPDPGSCESVDRPAPRIGPDGEFVADPDGRSIRVLTRLDTRLMFEDLYLKLAAHERWTAAG